MKYRFQALAVGAALIASTATAQSVAPLGLGDMLAAAVRYEKPTADRFTPRATDEAIIGRPFKIDVRFPEMADEGGPQAGRLGGWTYDADRGMLRLTPWVDMLVGDELGSDPALKGVAKRFHGFAIKARGRYIGRAAEGNAFGASVSVDQYTATTLAIGSYSEGWGRPVFPDPAGSKPEQSVAVAPVEARALAAHLRFVVDGVVAAYSPGRAIACGDTITPATFERRSERVIHQCVVSARIDRFAVEDDRSGRVLAEWKAPEAAAR